MTFRYRAKVLLALSVVRNVAWFDSELNMTKDLNKLCGAEYFILITLAVYGGNCRKIEQVVHVFN